jgi:hypothetical protein
MFNEYEGPVKLREIALVGLASNASEVAVSLGSDSYKKYSMGYHSIGDKHNVTGWLVSYADKKNGQVIKSHDFGAPGHIGYSEKISEWSARHRPPTIGRFIDTAIGKLIISNYCEDGGTILSALEVVKPEKYCQTGFNLKVPVGLEHVIHEMFPKNSKGRIVTISKNLGISALILCAKNRQQANHNKAVTHAAKVVEL